MIEIIFNSVVAYFSTNLDYLLVLVLLLGSYKNPKLVLTGDLIGTVGLTLLPMAIARILGAVPEMWILGLLGIFPILFGIKELIPPKPHSRDEIDGDSNISKIRIVTKVIAITITACGADNVAVFIPIFIKKTNLELFLALITMIIMAVIFFFVAILIEDNKPIKNILGKYGRYFSSVVYIMLGISVLVQNGTIAHFFH